MTLGWRCIDCKKENRFAIPDNGPIPIQDAYDLIMNQHIAALLPPGQVYVRGITPKSAMDDAIIISFVTPGPTTLRSEKGQLIVKTEPDSKWPDFEVRHCR